MGSVEWFFILDPLYLKLSIDKPLTLAVIQVLHGTIIVNIENLTRIHFDAKIKSAHIQRTARGRSLHMRGTHVTSHLAAPREVAPIQITTRSPGRFFCPI